MLYEMIEKVLRRYYSEVSYLKYYSAIDSEIMKDTSYTKNVYKSISKLLYDIKGKNTQVCFIVHGGQLYPGLKVKHWIYDTSKVEIILDEQHVKINVLAINRSIEIPLCYILAVLEQSIDKAYYMLRDFTTIDPLDIDKNISELNEEYKKIYGTRIKKGIL